LTCESFLISSLVLEEEKKQLEEKILQAPHGNFSIYINLLTISPSNNCKYSLYWIITSAAASLTPSSSSSVSKESLKLLKQKWNEQTKEKATALIKEVS
jgi:hypothetical protein